MQLLPIMIEVPVPADDGQATILSLSSGKVVFIAGPNGVGKSSLVDLISRQVHDPNILETFSGHRQIIFNNEDTDNIGQSLEAFQLQLIQHRNVANRYRGAWGEQHLKAVVRRITNSHSQTSHDIADLIEGGASPEDALKGRRRMLSIISEIFAAARIPISFTSEHGMLRAVRDGFRYTIDRLSDGERAALLLAGGVLTRPINSHIIIDEPEKHLNPAISGPFISALLRQRPDIGYVISSHDLSLIDWLEPDEVIHLRNSIVIDAQSDLRTYSIARLGKSASLDPELRRAVLGSRKALLLVEGDSTSEDKALYGLVYPKWTIGAKGDWEAVQNGVRAIKRNEDYIWLTVAGIVDGDGRDAGERTKLAESDVFPLTCAAIENVFLLPPILLEITKARLAHEGGKSVDESMASAAETAHALLISSKEEIVARQLVWRSTRALSERKISYDMALSGASSIDGVDLDAIRSELSSQYDTILRDSDPLEALLLFPIKATKIPQRVANAAGFENFKKYQRTILTHLQNETQHGQAIMGSLRSYLPDLPPIE